MENYRRTIEITLISADGIKKRMFGKMDVCAEAFIFGFPETCQTTRVDKNCGTSPQWNQKMRFYVDEQTPALWGPSIHIRLKAVHYFWPTKKLGEVSLSVRELIKNAVENGVERVVEDQVWTSSRRRKGVLQFSYRIGKRVLYGNGETNNPDEVVNV